MFPGLESLVCKQNHAIYVISNVNVQHMKDLGLTPLRSLTYTMLIDSSGRASFIAFDPAPKI